jgi:phenylalanyl-tRNA synthetase beta chain
MKISLDWLREYVEFPEDVETLAELLTMSGLEVEAIHTRGAAIPNVVVAQIRESVQHPNADRLSVCQVDDGSGAPRQIVCGAKNYRVGDKVPLAVPGAVLPGDFRIKAGKLRGVESNGMLCSAKELLLADDADGLLILPPDAVVGAPLSEVFPADTVFDLEVTPNRPDLLHHYGIAREVAALAGLPLKTPRWRQAELNYSHGVEIAAEECPFYTARCIQGVKVGPSPDWLRRRLESVGLRSINNVVDITNYVMLDRGQPLHAFDAEKIEGDLRVRLAEEGEKFPALNGVTYELKPHHLVIADDRRAVALAGVMGGQETGVTESTTRLWLESAYFLPSSVRCTSRQLGLLSDSSYRFERDVDPAGVVVASQEATQLLADLAGGQPGELRLGFAANSQFGFDAEGAVEGTEYTGVVPLRPERCSDILGADISEEDIAHVLTGFGLKQTPNGWEIPSFRPDLTREIDLVEEIARVVGIEALPSENVGRFVPSSIVDQEHDRAMVLRRALAAFGLHETRTLTLTSEKALRHHFAGGELARIKNPLGEEHAILRPSLVPGLLDALARNARRGEESIRLFELGRVFIGAEVSEQMHAAIVLTGPLQAGSWRTRATAPADLTDLKGLLSEALGRELELRPASRPELALFAEVLIDGRAIGHAGQLWPADARALDASAAVVFAEVALEEWLRAPAATRRYQEIPRFPAVTRDIAMVAPHTLTHAQISAALQAASEPLLAHVRLFDLFSDPAGEKLPADKKSVAYSLTYRSPERTLTADEVNAAHARLKERLVRELGVQLRE